MKPKIIAAVILVAVALIVWAVLSARPNPGQSGEPKEMVEAFMTGQVSSVIGSRVAFKVGMQEFAANINGDTEITKLTTPLGKRVEGPGQLSDIVPNAKITVHYKVEKNRSLDDPIFEVNATKVTVQP